MNLLQDGSRFHRNRLQPLATTRIHLILANSGCQVVMDWSLVELQPLQCYTFEMVEKLAVT